MATQITNHKCPACTGPLHYVGSTGKLQCDYCGSSYTAEEIEAFYKKAEEAAAEAFEESPKEVSWDGMRTYSCPSCGAELLCDESTAATSCPYCGNPTVIPGQFQGSKRPDFIIPFAIDKKEAAATLQEHYKGKHLLPKAFAAKNDVKKIQGVYVPFWLYDGQTNADMTFEGEKNNRYQEGDYEITITDHFELRRAGRLSFRKIPVSASLKMEDNYMDAIEPFHYQDLKAFSTAYLPGFLADKCDVTSENLQDRVEERCETTTADLLWKDARINYSNVQEKSRSCEYHLEQAHYALLPVWLLTTQFEGRRYLFAMNGQTGKMVSELPVDQKKATLWTVYLTLGIGFALFLLWYLTMYL